MVGIEIDLDPPLERAPGDAQILQSRQEEIVHHLILPRHGLDEFRLRVDIVDQAVRVFAHLKEIRFLRHGLDRPSADGAVALLRQLALGIESLALLTVKSVEAALIDIPLIVETLEDLLDLRLVISIRRADEAVIARAEQIAEPLDLRRGLIHELLGCGAAGLDGADLDLLPVLIRARQKMDIIAVRPLVSRDGIRQHDLVIVADMRLARSIGDRRCQIVFSLVFHIPYPPQLQRISQPSSVTTSSTSHWAEGIRSAV